jgi:hypothetical protein
MQKEGARGGSAYPPGAGTMRTGVSAMIQGKIRQTGAGGKSVMASLLSAGALVVLQAAASPTPIKLAIFDFELEDSSAGASSTVSADTMQLTSVTNDVRQLSSDRDATFRSMAVPRTRTQLGRTRCVIAMSALPPSPDY